jgi:FkbH-like protein
MKRVKNLPLLSPGMLPLNKSEPCEQPIGTNGLSRSAAYSHVHMTTELSKSEERLDFLLISDFNLSNLAALLSKDEESPVICAATAPFGQVMQVLLESASQFWSKGTQGVVVWTSPESVSPGYRRLLESEEVEPEELMHEVDEFCSAIKAIRGHVKHVFVPSWVVGPFENRLGLLDMDLRHGLSLALMRMNVRLAEGLQDDSRIFVLDAGRWVAIHGERSFSQRLWYMSKTPFGLEFLKTAAGEIKAALRALTGRAKKLLLVDLDDTLWGGVVGDLGWQNLRLGGIDPVGEAFRDFQLGLKALKRRGVLLGIVSKNEENTALEAIRSHPEMALRQDDFAGWRINWDDKAQNIIDLVSELNLGLQSVVFIDDSPVERARVREALPDVFVPEWPANVMGRNAALMQLHCFDAPLVSAEDVGRTNMYIAERKRRTARTEVASLAEWLDSLNVRVVAERLHEANLDRATQLLNKTNQMNLSTRRMTKEELRSWNQQPENTALVFRVSDRFGDYGLVGVASFVLRDGNANVVDFVLSCRAMGRKVEETMLHVMSVYARSAGVTDLHIAYIPTLKNQPCLRFFESAGLLSNGDDKVFTLDLRKAYSKPATTHLVLFDSSQERARQIDL